MYKKFLKVELYRAGTKGKLTRSRLLVQTIYATHNNSQPNDPSPVYNIRRACVVDLHVLGLGIVEPVLSLNN